MYNDIIVGDIVGKANFPHQFAEVIQKNDKFIIVEPNSKQGKQLAIMKKEFDRGVFQKMEIEEGEIIVEETEKLEKKQDIV